MLPIAFVGGIFAGPLMGLFQVDDPDGRLALRLMLGAAVVASLGNPATLLLAVIDRIWVASVLNISWAVVALCRLVVASITAQLVGAAFATLTRFTSSSRDARLAHDRAPRQHQFLIFTPCTRTRLFTCVRWSSAISTGRRR
jgi:hypothetical protein